MYPNAVLYEVIDENVFGIILLFFISTEVMLIGRTFFLM